MGKHPHQTPRERGDHEGRQDGEGNPRPGPARRLDDDETSVLVNAFHGRLERGRRHEVGVDGPFAVDHGVAIGDGDRDRGSRIVPCSVSPSCC